eukprot:TRINITY_DN6327_c0_g1_i1.p1 TRINITY_DN6327_c0_g1~~TRINITY_DN6327_c0_g1_i1.p1  ORF type:complete len:171 (-),score=51.67 TRINITY_DN6327_c0_g1_i1:516-1028(-)
MSSKRISVGDRIPGDSYFWYLHPQEEVCSRADPHKVTYAEIFAGKRVVLFAVPGAYTTTCTFDHIPGYVEKADELKAKGVDHIICTAVNDPYVMESWGRTMKAHGRVWMLSDGNGTFHKAVGLECDCSQWGMGIRSERYAMVVEDGLVKQLFVDPDAVQGSGVDNILSVL